MTTKQNIEKVLWSACDSFRGKIDSSRYKDYILSMLFVKYLTDVYNETRDKYVKQYDGDERRIERAMSRERFIMDKTSTFTYLYDNRNDAEIGQKINVALAAIENNNSAKLHNVFRAIDFNSTVDFGEVKEKNAILKNLLEDFKDFRPYKTDLAYYKKARAHFETAEWLNVLQTLHRTPEKKAASSIRQARFLSWLRSWLHPKKTTAFMIPPAEAAVCF